MTRIFVRRRDGQPLGTRPIVVEMGGRRLLVKRVIIRGPSIVVSVPEAGPGKPRVWIETKATVEVTR